MPEFSSAIGLIVLTTLSIHQFAIAEKLQLDLQQGMTAITGETGAGKSISIDALSLALGARADSKDVRVGAKRADISAVFDIHALPQIKAWLSAQELSDDDECILRRTISSDGRSKAYINSFPVNLSTLKTLGDQLVDIHSQHAHHQLLQSDYHQVLLDAYAHNEPLLKPLASAYQALKNSQKQLKQLQESLSDAEQRKQFLNFQLEEFSELSLQEGEYQHLEQQHAIASRSDALKSALQHSLLICREQEQFAVLDQLHQCLHKIEEFSQFSPAIAEIEELLNSASIQISEACTALDRQWQHADDNLDLAALEARLSAIHSLARKNRILPDQILVLQSQLEQELASLNHSDEQIIVLEKQCQQQLGEYQTLAQKLTDARQKAAQALETEVHQQLKLLGMQHCRFQVNLNSNHHLISAAGFEEIAFFISTNPASAPDALHKIASGGELSRISLAIQVVTAKSSSIPVLIFDEVDVGIGGATAEVVGHLLNQLGQSAQVICVTHQAQVASCANQHLLVSKHLLNNAMNTEIQNLNEVQKIEEIARMLGGLSITQATRQHAAEMIKQARNL